MPGADNNDDDDNNNPQLVDVTQITLWYTILYFATLVNQFLHKKYYQRLYRRSGKRLDRYNSQEMQNPDRLTGNFIEWTPVFLSPIWCLSITRTLSSQSIHVSYAYLALRLFYFALSIKYGVSYDGNNKPLWISTFPAYVCLFYLYKEAISNILLL
jgi:hypothetical protein